VVGSAGALTPWIALQIRDVERALESTASALGATSADFQVGVGEAWAELSALYVIVVLVPPTIFVLAWRHRRAEHARSAAGRPPHPET
jgi:hypothetical protein